MKDPVPTPVPENPAYSNADPKDEKTSATILEYSLIGINWLFVLFIWFTLYKNIYI